MPNYYRFESQKCNENKTFRENSIAGCKYEPKVKDFTPQTRNPKGVIQNRPNYKPPVTKSLPDKVQLPVTDELDQSETNQIDTPSNMSLYGLGHILPKDKSSLVDEGNDDTEINFDGGKGIIKNINKEFTPNTKSVDVETKNAAIFSEATYHALKSDLKAAQNYINKHTGTDRFKIDAETSNKDILTIVDTNTNETTIAYRGSATKADWTFNTMNFAKDLGSFATPFKAVGFLSSKHPHMKRNDNHIEMVKNKGHNITHVVGHSYGGFQALRTSAKENIPVTVFNPEIFFKNHDILAKIESNGTKATIHRTTHDIASYGLLSYKLKRDLGLIKVDRVKGIIKDAVHSSLQTGLKEGIQSGAKKGMDEIKHGFANNISSEIKVNSYSPLTGNETPLGSHSLDNWINENNKPVSSNTTRTSSQNIRNIAVQGSGQIAIGVGADMLANEFLNTLKDKTNIQIDPVLTNALQGGTSSALSEAATRGLGMGTTIGGRPVSLGTAALAGAITTPLSTHIGQQAFQSLVENGVNENTAELLAGGTSGGVQGGSEYAASVAINYVEHKYGQGVISAAVRNAIAQGVERVGIGETISFIAGRTASTAFRGSRGGWWGALLGAGIGVVSAGVDIATKHEERNMFALTPSAYYNDDMIIGRDEQILKLLKEFNEAIQNHINDDNVTTNPIYLEYNNKLENRIDSMILEGSLTKKLPINLLKVPEHATTTFLDGSTNYMLKGEYDEEVQFLDRHSGEYLGEENTDARANFFAEYGYLPPENDDVNEDATWSSLPPPPEAKEHTRPPPDPHPNLLPLPTLPSQDNEQDGDIKGS